MVEESAPLAAQKPDRRLLGYDHAGRWQNGVRKIAVDVKSARHTPWLHEQQPTVTCAENLNELRIPANTPTAIRLDFGQLFPTRLWLGHFKSIKRTSTDATVW